VVSPVKTAIIKYGPISIHWFGIVVALALVAGLIVSIIMARLRGQRAEPLAGIMMLGLLAGVIGGRIWYFVFRKDWYNPDPGRVFAVWQGGLALHGALIGAILATLIYTWNHRLSFWTWADICAPGLILGQAIGRLGDLLNNQAFGPPTNGTFAVIIPPENRPPHYLNFSHFTPTAAYESAWDLAVFVVLIGLTLLQLWRPRVLPAGAIFLLYMILYSIGRIPLEGMRLDSLWAGNIRVAQIASWVMIVSGVLLYLVRLLPRRETAPIVSPVLKGQVTDAYLIAAARSGPARYEHDTRAWGDVDGDTGTFGNGNGARQPASAPAANVTLQLRNMPSAKDAPLEESQ
jgi:phosphatidylglycerol:prolipoprotein diacylglycerol transferase